MMVDIAGLRKLLADADPPPWNDTELRYEDGTWIEKAKCNGRLAIAAVNALPALLDIAERQPAPLAECEEMAKRLDTLSAVCDPSKSHVRARAEVTFADVSAGLADAASLLRRPRQTADAAEMRIGSSVEGWLEETHRVAAEMRERCAKVCDDRVKLENEYATMHPGGIELHALRLAVYQTAQGLAASIRAIPLSPTPQEADNG